MISNIQTIRAIPEYNRTSPIDGVGIDQLINFATIYGGVRLYTGPPLGPFAESCEELGADSAMHAKIWS